jgi:hypothetical protein
MTTFRRPRHLLKILAAENSGVAAIEFALVAMVFLVILAGTVDLGMLIYTEEQLGAALAAGAEYAEANAGSVSNNGSNLATEIANIVANVNGSGWASSSVCVNNSAPNSAPSGSSTTSPTTSCSGPAGESYCPQGSPGNWSWGNSAIAGSACASGGIAGQFVAITASRAVSPLFPAFGFVQNGTISQSVLVETE